MIYTDTVHMIGSSIDELHEFAAKIGLHRCYYRNPRYKKHPHYDLMTNKIIQAALDNGAELVSDKTIVKLCREFYGPREIKKKK